MAKCIAAVEKTSGYRPQGEKDFRKVLEKKDVDAIVIATPDHWHAPAALLAMQAGKDVYLEKPCSHVPAEGEMLMAAAAKYNSTIQMGNQRRSWPNVQEAVKAIHNGAIGNVCFAKAWYTNNRASIGTGKPAAVPSHLDWDLWQGPAPRTEYRDNIVHYNWHWFWKWGTGEALNNGTHMVDVARWAMKLDYPTAVSSTGGRYFYNDDWETPDTQVINLEFEGGKMISWEGRSCNSRSINGESVGCEFYGSNGSLMIAGGDSYTIFDSKGKVVKQQNSTLPADPRNLMNPSEQLDALHISNFFNGVRNGDPLTSDIESGHKSTLLVQLGNIALRSGRRLLINPANGHILNNPEAAALWSRSYQPGWEMKL
jgi:predicted dehydrogenase